MFKKIKKVLSLSLALATFLCVPTGVSADTDKTQKGDVNADGKFGITDVLTLKKWLLGVSGVTLADPDAADFLEDGKLNSFDLMLMKRALIEERKENALLISDVQKRVFPTNGSNYQRAKTYLTDNELSHYPEIVSALERVSAKADSLKAAQMKELNFRLDKKYGCDELYLPCKDGSDILLCKIGKESSWLDDPDVRLLVVLLVRNNFFSNDNEYFEEIEKTLLTDASSLDRHIAGNAYIYEKEGFGGPFVISFGRDGSFLYTPGHLSSDLGSGRWEICGDTLVLTEFAGKKDNVICLKIQGDELIYDADPSDDFRLNRTQNGDRFLPYNDDSVALLAKPKAFDIKPTKEGVSEFLKMSDTKHYNISEENCYNITPDEERFEKRGYKLFKDNETCDTYAVYDNKYVYKIAECFGGCGVTSLAIADMDLNGRDEIYFAYSWGSGEHRSVIGSLGGYMEPEFTNWDSDIVFVTDNGRLEIYDADIKGDSFVDIEAVPKEKLGEVVLDLSQNVSKQVTFKAIDKKS